MKLLRKINNSSFLFVVIVLTIIITILMLNIKNTNNLSVNNSISSNSITSLNSTLSKEEIINKINEINNKTNDPFLKLISKKEPLDLKYLPTLTTINGSNNKVDKRIINELNNMLSDGKKEGVKLYIQSAYRSANEQKSLYNNKINELLPVFSNNKTTATIEASKIVAPPGTSEHQYGMSIDIVEKAVSSLVPEVEEKTPSFQWLYNNCSKYGFILRYPKDKTEITGIMYEPWHFRYVGVENATTIMSLGLTLEEYIEKFKNEIKVLEDKLNK